MEVDASILAHVQRALQHYHEVVEAADLAPDTKRTYLRHADTFVRWLGGDFAPGGLSDSPQTWRMPVRDLFSWDKGGWITPKRKLRASGLPMGPSGSTGRGFKIDGRDLHDWWKMGAQAEVRDSGEYLEIVRIFAPEPEAAEASNQA